MKRKNMTRSALVTSIISLLLCVSMLVGTTFAWFTDSVESGVNQIIAGNLDVELYHTNDNVINDDVTGETELFKDVQLWEPGAVAYETLTVKNVGNLALKYQMSVNFENETKVNGYGLSQALKVGTIDGALDAGTTRENLIATVSNWTPLSNFVLPGELENQNDEKAVTVVIYWQPGDNDFDNLFNMNNGKGEPLTIDLGVKLVATQLEAEFDSFGDDYDKDAAWDGVVPTEMPETLVVDGETQTVHVKDAAAFAYLSSLSAKWVELYTDGNGTDYTNYANGKGGNYYYSGQWTVSLEADINLMNYPIAPVEIVFGQGTGATVFNGNGHTIRNINTTTGLFADGTRANYANLVLDNVKATKGALTGVSNSSITNVTVKNATITGADYVGGLVGRLFSSVSYCKVIDSSIVATGKEAGGLIGYAEANSKGSTISGNTVNNVSVSANNRAAGLVAQPNTTVKVYNNTVDTVTVVAADTSEYQPGAVVSNALAPANVYDNTVNNCKVGREVYGLTLFPNGENSQIIVNDKEGFLNLTKLFNDWTALFTDGNGSAYSNYANGAGADYYYAGRWTVSLEADIDLNNATIAPVTIKHPVSAGAPTFNGNDHTISNAKIVTDAATENEAGLFNASSIAFKNLKLDNIHVTGSNVGNSTAGVLSGSCNAPVSNITITNSSVTGGKYTGGVVGYGYTDITNCTLTNVTVKGGYKLGGVIGYICASGTNTGDVTGNTLTDCTVDGIGGGVYAGGKDKYIIGKVVGNYNCNGTCNNNTITNMTTSATANIGEIEAGKAVTQ